MSGLLIGPGNGSTGRRPLRVAFAVQGEGRGHMTQALALGELLRAQGHAVCGVLVGRSEGRPLPAFFTAGVGAPVVGVESPNFAYEGHAVHLGRTVERTLRRSRHYTRALRRVRQRLDAWRPDVVVNFYEGMLGLAVPAGVPVVCVGHQYMFGHPAYRFASGQRLGRAAAKAYTRLTATAAAHRLALSFYPAADLPGLTVVPPLLRRAVRRLDGAESDGSFLLYLLNQGMAETVEAWHRRRPEIVLHAFWDGPARRPHPNLTFHPLCGERFIERMAKARGVVCTAGFESVSEALWLGKPVFMLPTAGHVEQRANALDAYCAGAGIYSARFDLDDFLHYLERPPDPGAHHRFREWVRGGEARIVHVIERAGGLRGPFYNTRRRLTNTRLAPTAS